MVYALILILVTALFVSYFEPYSGKTKQEDNVTVAKTIHQGKYFSKRDSKKENQSKNTVCSMRRQFVVVFVQWSGNITRIVFSAVNSDRCSMLPPSDSLAEKPLIKMIP